MFWHRLLRGSNPWPLALKASGLTTRLPYSPMLFHSCVPLLFHGSYWSQLFLTCDSFYCSQSMFHEWISLFSGLYCSQSFLYHHSVCRSQSMLFRKWISLFNGSYWSVIFIPRFILLLTVYVVLRMNTAAQWLRVYVALRMSIAVQWFILVTVICPPLDFNQVCMDIILGHGSELIWFWWPWHDFQGPCGT